MINENVVDINEGINDGAKAVISDGVSDSVKDDILSIVKLIADNEGINTNNIVKSVGNKSKPTIELYLSIARKLNIIGFKGAAKSGGYFITEKIKSKSRK